MWDPNGRLKVKVTTYTGTVTATVSAKGKLDTLNPDSGIIYTVKLKNCTGTVSGVESSGQDKYLFEAEVEDGKVTSPTTTKIAKEALILFSN